MRTVFLSIVVSIVIGPLLGADTLLSKALEQDPPPVKIQTGWEIPSEGYCDQPYVLKLSDGTWLCTMTTGRGNEGQTGQHIVSCRSTDKGKTWSPLDDIGPAGGPEASWAMPYLTSYGRVYVFYTYNADNMREVSGAGRGVDTIGRYAYKYSDDGGRSWSEKRWYIPIRATDIDRRNPYKGTVRFFWGVKDQPQSPPLLVFRCIRSMSRANLHYNFIGSDEKSSTLRLPKQVCVL